LPRAPEHGRWMHNKNMTTKIEKIIFSTLFLLSLCTPAFADPIIDPKSSIFLLSSAILVLGAEVGVTIWYLRTYSFRLIRLIPALLAMNIFSYSLLFPIMYKLQNILFFPLTQIAAESIIIFGEALVIYGISKITWFRKPECSILPLPYALRTSLVSNVFSILLGFAVALVLTPLYLKYIRKLPI
jgi:hypothetical protein